MTKKDYELMANEIHVHVDDEVTQRLMFIVTANVFQKDNPLFDRAKYERAVYEGKHIRQSIKS